MWPDVAAGDVQLGLAVSGGPDSLALLVLAAAALPGRVAVATVDHGLRPESGAEADMVAAVCRERDVPHETIAVSLASGNLQDRARKARYAALEKWCLRCGLGALATGHQRDDQAETLVMRLNRGSGLAGLAGVRARGIVPGGDLPLLRPLLGWSRQDLASVVAAAGLAPASDSSNDDERFDRVRIRRALAGAEWLKPEGFAHSAALLAEAETFLSATIAEMARQRVGTRGAGLVLAPPPSDFAAVELCARILADLGATASRSEIAGLVERLRRGENASLAGVLACVERESWIFAAEPPRRTA